MILGTMAAGLCLAAISNGFAAGDEDILVGGQTTHEPIQYDPTGNVLTITGGQGDDRIEVALSPEGIVLLNGVSMSKLGIRLMGVPTVIVYGGGGNDVLISRRFPVAVMNGGDGQDALIWDNGDSKFERLTYGTDLLVWNSSDIQRSFGGAGLDILIGNTGGDRLECCGGLGQDDLIGGNTWEGSSRVDIGYAGSDLLIGGLGDDSIEFRAISLLTGDIFTSIRAATGDSALVGWGEDWIVGGTGRDN